MSHLKPEGESKEKHHPSIYIGVSRGWNIGVCIESPETRSRKCARRKKKGTVTYEPKLDRLNDGSRDTNNRTKWPESCKIDG